MDNIEKNDSSEPANEENKNTDSTPNISFEQFNDSDETIVKLKRKNKTLLITVISAVVVIAGVILYPIIKNKFFPTAVPTTENLECLGSSSAVYEHYKNAVVLIRHRYAYQVKIKDAEPILLDFSEDYTKEITGTGFFVDSLGNIMTNQHIIKPWDYDEKKDQTLENVRHFIASKIQVTDAPEDYRNIISRAILGQNEEAEAATEESEAAIDTATTLTDDQDIDLNVEPSEFISPYDIQVEVVTLALEVALHDTSDEWLPCEKTYTTESQEIDLGLIALKSEITPSSVTNYVNLRKQYEVATDSIKETPGTPISMIGFPMGLDLATTNQGVKVQLYEGKISKESDGTQIQYNITSAQGASGSPIFDNCGNILAVNYSGLNQVQGFNFGFVRKQIFEMYFRFNPIETVNTVEIKH